MSKALPRMSQTTMLNLMKMSGQSNITEKRKLNGGRSLRELKVSKKIVKFLVTRKVNSSSRTCS